MKPGYLLLPAILFIFFAVSCSKGGSKGKPTLTFVGYERNPAGHNDSMVAHFKFSTGDQVQNGVFISLRNRVNQSPPGSPSGNDTLYNPIPDLEGTNKGEFRYVLQVNGYLSQSQTGPQGENDTIVMQFWVISGSGVSSDTITAPKFVALFN